MKQTENHQKISKNKFSNRRLLIIDDELNMRHMLSALLGKAGFQVETAEDGCRAIQMIEKIEYDFILCDIKMPNMSGMDFLKSAGDKIKDTTIIMMSAYGTIDIAVKAMKLGAYDYISKPFKTDEILITLKKAEERKILKQENRRLRKHICNIEDNYNIFNMVGKSKTMVSLFKRALKVSQYDTTVLITGASGTGKEMIAKGIHFSGKRSKMPLVSVNCGGIPENLLESELFGYKKGAFSGANRDKKGLFQEAEGGTIFLDEIGELPLFLQVKFLRVLQENEIRPVGDSRTNKIDVRVIAATSRNLEDEVRKGVFREDLFYRLNVLSIKVPALKERSEDIPLLCEHFIRKYNKKLGKNIRRIAPSAMTLLMNHNWPGNVRELENVIERTFVLAEEDVLFPENFPPGLGVKTEGDEMDDLFTGYSLKSAQKVLEKRLIIRALTETGGNRTKASRLLEISHPSLLSKIKSYNIIM